jgi:hypothetical protein
MVILVGVDANDLYDAYCVKDEKLHVRLNNGY